VLHRSEHEVRNLGLDVDALGSTGGDELAETSPLVAQAAMNSLSSVAVGGFSVVNFFHCVTRVSILPFSTASARTP
jgi:hypothetical protein